MKEVIPLTPYLFDDGEGNFEVVTLTQDQIRLLIYLTHNDFLVDNFNFSELDLNNMTEI